MYSVPVGADIDEFARWLKYQRNDLLPPARQIAPEIDAALNTLESNPLVLAAGLSGSGATCYGLVRDIGAARQVAKSIQVSHMNWWVVPTQVLK